MIFWHSYYVQCLKVFLVTTLVEFLLLFFMTWCLWIFFNHLINSERVFDWVFRGIEPFFFINYSFFFRLKDLYENFMKSFFKRAILNRLWTHSWENLKKAIRSNLWMNILRNYWSNIWINFKRYRIKLLLKSFKNIIRNFMCNFWTISRDND